MCHDSIRYLHAHLNARQRKFILRAVALRSSSRSRLISSPGFHGCRMDSDQQRLFFFPLPQTLFIRLQHQVRRPPTAFLRGTTSARRDGTVWGAPLVSELPQMIVVTLTQLIIRRKCRTPVGLIAYQKEPVCVFFCHGKYFGDVKYHV